MPLITIKPPRRPSATVNSPGRSLSPTTVSYDAGREVSPDAPPASPLSPVLGAAKPSDAQQPDFTPPNPTQQRSQRSSESTSQHADGHMPSAELIDMPHAVPFSGEDSTDAIALRAAISSLQFQRVRAQNDLRTLQEVKKQAVERPEAFSQHLQDLASRATRPTSVPPQDNDSSDDDDEANIADTMAGAKHVESRSQRSPSLAPTSREEIPDSQQTLYMMDASVDAHSNAQIEHTPAFPPIPGPQNVVRCPPIEWSKYHILGESLDKLHQEQQVRPGVGGHEGRESIIAGPYNPFVDRLTTAQTSITEQTLEGRKDSGASTTESTTQRRRSSKVALASD